MIITLSTFNDLNLGKNINQFMPSLVLLRNIRKNLDEGNIGCSIFVSFQKSFNTVEHDFLLSKLEHYGICALANGWFKSYL